MSILLQKKNVGDYSYMSSPNIYYRAIVCIYMLIVSILCIGTVVDRDILVSILYLGESAIVIYRPKVYFYAY